MTSEELKKDLETSLKKWLKHRDDLLKNLELMEVLAKSLGYRIDKVTHTLIKLK